MAGLARHSEELERRLALSELGWVQGKLGEVQSGVSGSTDSK